MFVELHILQNFAPSNLNRDDTGAPKDCEFGGYRRARISSQCLKRAVRRVFRDNALGDLDPLANRTKRVVGRVADALAEQGRDRAQAVTATVWALLALDIRADKSVSAAGNGEADEPAGGDPKTQYLLYLSGAEVDRLRAAVEEHWDQLTNKKVAGEAEKAAQINNPTKRKAAARKALGKDVMARMAGFLEERAQGTAAVDLALFGRMLADLPDKNFDAACQVAHALSTNRVSMEMDYYTAVDDFKPGDTSGADMIGTVEFNSSCFYRYASINIRELWKNLGKNKDLAVQAVEAFIRASVDAVPTGKQNSFAAHNPPSLVFAVVRKAGQWSLANAFVQPVRPTPQKDLVRASAEALDGYWGRLTAVYGAAGITSRAVVLLHEVGLKHLAGDQVESDEHLYKRVADALAAWAPGEAAQ